MISYEEALSSVMKDGLGKSIVHPPKTLQNIVNWGNKISPHYERLFPILRKTWQRNDWRSIVNVYRRVANRAKKAAAQTTLCLRSVGFPRDVARLVGRTVYDTRLTDARYWWRCEESCEEKSKRQKSF